jgi:CheY-like chemotaxis protein
MIVRRVPSWGYDGMKMDTRNGGAVSMAPFFGMIGCMPSSGTKPANESSSTPLQHDDPEPGSKRAPVILVVEDDDDVRAIVEELLMDHGFHTLSAANGSEALAHMRSSANIDLLFTDVVMPGGMNGRDVAAAAAEIRPDLKVLFTSGYLGHALAGGGASALGPRPFLAKPYRPAKLLEAIKALIGS